MSPRKLNPPSWSRHAATDYLRPPRRPSWEGRTMKKLLTHPVTWCFVFAGAFGVMADRAIAADHLLISIPWGLACVCCAVAGLFVLTASGKW